MDLAGQTVSHYHVIRKLGSGGMGVVYEGEDIRLRRRVALKFLPESLAHSQEALQRFEREARAASCLNHPNICTIHEIEEHEGQPVIVMELIEGCTLKERLAHGPLPPELVLDLAIDICHGLEAAHARGIIHRDIKPANIFVTKLGTAKILDFGLAKLLPRPSAHEGDVPQQDLEQSLTVAGQIHGTTRYMSPEQARGDELDRRTDLFSLGVVLYEMATGERPFAEKNAVLTIDAILNANPEPAFKVNPALPAGVDAVIEKALVKRRERRYQMAAEMAADLKRVRREMMAAAGQVAPEPAGSRGSKSAQAGSLRPASLASTPRPSRYFKFLVPAALVIALALAGTAFFLGRGVSALSEKDTIVLADFENKTGDPVFDETLKQALAVDLGQSPFLNILSDAKVAGTLRLMGRPPDQRVTGEVAREVCQRVASKAMLAGSISALGNTYVIGLNAINCATGDALVKSQIEARDKEDVLKSLGSTAKEMRQKLGESLASVQKFATPIEDATTPSLEALKAYSLGRKVLRAQGSAAAIPYYERAVELDPNFAMAYSALAVADANVGQATRSREAANKAFQLRERVSEREKYRISAAYYTYATGELDKATQTYELWKQSYPRDTIPPFNLGDIGVKTGQWDSALRETEDVLTLEPMTAGAIGNLAEILLALNRPDDAAARVQEALARKLDSVDLRFSIYAAAFLKDDEQMMQQQMLAWAAGQPGQEDWLLSFQSDTEAYFGRLAKARELSQRAVISARHADAKEPAGLWQVNAALREAEFGNREAAREGARVALSWVRGEDVRSLAALALARAGDVAQAQKLADGLNQDFPQNTIVQAYWLPSIRAAIQLRANNAGHSLEVLQSATHYELRQCDPYLVGMLYPLYLRGYAYLLARRGTEAATQFQKIIDHRGIVLNFPLGALARLGLARAYVLQGDKAKARAAYQEFLTLWKDADPDIPILRQAKAEYAKLE